MNKTGKVIKVWAYATTDGELWLEESEAETHQYILNFREWRQNNICIGGEWDSEMVANKILEDWRVTRRGEEDE